MNNIKWYAICLVSGLILGWVLLPRTPDVKVITQTLTVDKKITQTKTIYQDRVIDRKIYVDTGGHVVTQEHIVEKPVIHETTNTVEKEKVVEKEVEKFNEHDWILSVDYQHEHSYPDVLSLSVSRKIIWNFYVTLGYGILVQPNIFANPSFELNPENWSIGVKLLF
jgi:hypothetical protein